MNVNDYATDSYNRYPRDVTSPGPYQRRGVALSQKTGPQDGRKKSPPPSKSENPPPQSQPDKDA